MKTALLLLLACVVATTFASGPSPPPFWDKAENARWLVHNLDYGVLSTFSSTMNSTAFGNPQSFADGAVDNSTGRLYFYVSTLDASCQDIEVNPSASFTLSLQMLDDYCTKEWAPVSKQIDPEDPRCTRLTLVGKVRNVTDAEEVAFANSSLFARHPEMASWPPSHDFHFVTMDIEDIWLINMFGGASIVKPSDYYGAKVPSTELSEMLTSPKASDPPPATDKAKTARWLAHNITYGVLSTTSVTYKAPFGNPQSFVDGSASNSSGLLYFYVSDLDASMKDLSANPAASFTLSEEFSNGYCSTAGIDPEDPRCARLVFTGTMRNTTGTEADTGKANLFDRHPGMTKWPADHSWHVVTLDIDHIWLIDFFGGASVISIQDYLGASP